MPFDKDFPHSTPENYLQTSPDDLRYNCIAWAAGESHRFWEPSRRGRFWPMKVSKSQRTEALIELFEYLGYQKCDSEELEAGFEKVALYTKDNVTCTHAARQKSSGLWTSKLGEQIDIEHTIETLQDGIYGNIYQYMRRKVSQN